MAFQFDHWEIDDGYLDQVLSAGKSRSKSLDSLPGVNHDNRHAAHGIDLFDRNQQDYHDQNSKDNNSKSSDKRVRFSDKTRIILIPSRQEYFDAGIDLWYSRSDQISAQNELHHEITEMKVNHPKLSFRMILDYLFHLHPNFLPVPPKYSDGTIDLFPESIHFADEVSEIFAETAANLGTNSFDQEQQQQQEHQERQGISLPASAILPPSDDSTPSLPSPQKEISPSRSPRTTNSSITPTKSDAPLSHNFITPPRNHLNKPHRRLDVLLISNSHDEAKIYANKIKESMASYYSLRIRYINSLPNAVRFFKYFLTANHNQSFYSMTEENSLFQQLHTSPPPPAHRRRCEADDNDDADENNKNNRAIDESEEEVADYYQNRKELKKKLKSMKNYQLFRKFRLDIVIMDTNIIIGHEPPDHFHYLMEDNQNQPVVIGKLLTSSPIPQSSSAATTGTPSSSSSNPTNSVIVLRKPMQFPNLPDEETPLVNNPDTTTTTTTSENVQTSKVYLPSSILEKNHQKDEDFLFMEFIDQHTQNPQLIQQYAQPSKSHSAATHLSSLSTLELSTSPPRTMDGDSLANHSPTTTKSASSSSASSQYAHIYYYKLTHLLELMYKIYHNQIMMGILMNSLDTLDILQRIIPQDNMIDFFWKKPIQDNQFTLLPFLLENHYLYYQDYTTSHPYFLSNSSSSMEQVYSGSRSGGGSGSQDDLDLRPQSLGQQQKQPSMLLIDSVKRHSIESMDLDQNLLNSSGEEGSGEGEPSERRVRNQPGEKGSPSSSHQNYYRLRKSNLDQRTIIPSYSYDSLNNEEQLKQLSVSKDIHDSCDTLEGGQLRERIQSIEEIDEMEYDNNEDEDGDGHVLNTSKTDLNLTLSTDDDSVALFQKPQPPQPPPAQLEATTLEPGTSSQPAGTTENSLTMTNAIYDQDNDEKLRESFRLYNSPTIQFRHAKRIDSLSSEEDSTYFRNTFMNANNLQFHGDPKFSMMMNFPKKLQKAESFSSGSSYLISHPQQPSTMSMHQKIYQNNNHSAGAKNSLLPPRIPSKMTTTTAQSSSVAENQQEKKQRKVRKKKKVVKKNVAQSEKKSSSDANNNSSSSGGGFWSFLFWGSSGTTTTSSNSQRTDFSRNMDNEEEGEEEEEEYEDGIEEEGDGDDVDEDDEEYSKGHFSPLKKAFTNDFLINNPEYSQYPQQKKDPLSVLTSKSEGNSLRSNAPQPAQRPGTAPSTARRNRIFL